MLKSGVAHVRKAASPPLGAGGAGVVVEEEEEEEVELVVVVVDAVVVVVVGIGHISWKEPQYLQVLAPSTNPVSRCVCV